MQEAGRLVPDRLRFMRLERTLALPKTVCNRFRRATLKIGRYRRFQFLKCMLADIVQ